MCKKQQLKLAGRSGRGLSMASAGCAHGKAYSFGIPLTGSLGISVTCQETRGQDAAVQVQQAVALSLLVVVCPMKFGHQASHHAQDFCMMWTHKQKGQAPAVLHLEDSAEQSRVVGLRHTACLAATQRHLLSFSGSYLRMLHPGHLTELPDRRLISHHAGSWQFAVKSSRTACIAFGEAFRPRQHSFLKHLSDPSLIDSITCSPVSHNL